MMLATSSRPDDAARQPARIMAAQIAGDAEPGNAADARADLLDRRHQRIAEQQGPGEAVAELRADLGIGGDAARIVVGGAGDQAGPHDLQQLRPLRLLDRIRRRNIRWQHFGDRPHERRKSADRHALTAAAAAGGFVPHSACKAASRTRPADHQRHRDVARVAVLPVRKFAEGPRDLAEGRTRGKAQRHDLVVEDEPQTIFFGVLGLKGLHAALRNLCIGRADSPVGRDADYEFPIPAR